MPLSKPPGLAALKNQLFSGDEWIWLFELRSPTDGPIHSPDGTDSILRCAARSEPVSYGTNVETGAPLLWRPWAIKLDDLPQDARGNISDVNCSFANHLGAGDSLLYDNDYLKGHQLLIHLVHAGLLDQPNEAISIRTTVVDATLSWESVTLRLSAFAFLDFAVPQRLITRKCGWQYRGKGCGFVGDPGNVELGGCKLTIEACHERGVWEAANGLAVAHPKRFGGFPALLAGPLPTAIP